MIDSRVRKYVNENNVEAVKSILTGLAYVVDFFETFKDSAEYARANLENIFDEDDGAEFNKEKTRNNYKYVARLMLDNFSEKKYEAVVEIGLDVFSDQAAEYAADGKQEEKALPFGQALGNLFKRVIKSIKQAIKRVIKRVIKAIKQAIKRAKKHPVLTVVVVIVIMGLIVYGIAKWKWNT